MTPSRVTLLPAVSLLGLFFAAFVVFSAVGVMQSVPEAPGYAPPLTLDNYLRFFSDPIAMGVLGWTMLFSLCVTLVTVAVGYPMAYLIARAERAWVGQLLLGVLIMTFLTGAISRAYGWMILLGRKGLVNEALLHLEWIERPLAMVYNTSSVFVALLHFTLPFFVLTVFGSIKAVPSRVEEAARDLGAGPLKVFASVTVPLTLPAIINGASLAFSLAISAYVFPLILGGGKVQLISNYIYDQLFVAYDLPYAAAISLVFLAISLLALLLCYLLESLVRRWVYRRSA